MPAKSCWLDGIKEDFGGGGAYSVVSDYMKVLTSILRNDGMLLSRESVQGMFKPHCKSQFLHALYLFPSSYFISLPRRFGSELTNTNTNTWNLK